MLIIRLISLVSILYLSSSYTYFSLFLLIGVLYYFLSFRAFFNSSVSILQSFLTVDSVSLFMVILLFLIMYISYILAFSSYSPSVMFVVLLSLFYFCFQVFSTTHLFQLYFYYEASLIPILYIIIK